MTSITRNNKLKILFYMPYWTALGSSLYSMTLNELLTLTDGITCSQIKSRLHDKP